MEKFSNSDTGERNSVDTGLETGGTARKRQKTMGDDKSTAAGKDDGNRKDYSRDISKILGLDLGRESENSNSDEMTWFLESPEVLWQESQTEKVLSYMGNGLFRDS